MIRASVALALLVMIGACGATPKQLTRSVARGGDGGARHVALWAAARAAWEKRADEAALRQAIARWKEIVALRDDDPEAYLMLARACFFLGDGFLFFDPKRQAELAATFEDGLAFADRGLRALWPEFERRRRDGVAVDEALGGLPYEAVPFLYWYANNLIRWAHRMGTMTLMNEYQRSHRIMHVVENIDPDYFYGGADRYFASFLAAAPAMAGGDLEEAKLRFEASLRRAPLFLETYVIYAELVAVKAKDRALYSRLLAKVTKTPPEVLPEAAPENARAQKKARKQLERTEARFAGIGGKISTP